MQVPSSSRPLQRITVASLLFITLLGSLTPAVFAIDEPFKGTITKSGLPQHHPTVNMDDIKTVAPGTTLDMVISTPITTGVSVTGDEFYGKVSKDYLVDGKVVIPKGTIVHGIVEKMQDARRAGRNGYIRTRFDYMITPDDREIAIEGKSTTEDSKGKAVAKVVGRAAGYTAMGGVVGAVMVLKYGGLAAAAASNGYALAGGAAVGGALGLTSAMVTRGHSAMLEQGAEIRVKLAEDLNLPTMNMPDPKTNDYTLDGLSVKVLGMRFTKDPFGDPNEIDLTLDVTNKTENTFSSFEIGLEDEYGNVFYPSPAGETGMWFTKIKPNMHCTSNLSFNVDNIHLPHTLIFFKPYTREPIAKFALTDTMKMDKKAFARQQAASRS